MSVSVMHGGRGVDVEEREGYLRSLPAMSRAHVEFYLLHGNAGQVLAVHVPDASGHCAGCTWEQAARPIWPCVMAVHAGMARDVHRRWPQAR